MMIFLNSSSLVSRPCVLIVSWNCWSGVERRGADASHRGLHVLGLDRLGDLGRE